MSNQSLNRNNYFNWKCNETLKKPLKAHNFLQQYARFRKTCSKYRWNQLFNLCEIIFAGHVCRFWSTPFKVYFSGSIKLVIAFVLNSKAFQLHSSFFFLFFLLVTFSGRTAKSFLANALTLVITKTCYQDLTYSLDTPKHIFVEVVLQVVVCDACGTWHGSYTVTSIHSIQKSTINCQNQPLETRKQVIQIASSWMAEDSRIKTERSRVDE